MLCCGTRLTYIYLTGGYFFHVRYTKVLLVLMIIMIMMKLMMMMMTMIDGCVGYLLQPTWPGGKISASGSTPNLLSATSLSTPSSAADLARQPWSSTTVLPMSRRPLPPVADQCRQSDHGSRGLDTAPLSFVQQSLHASATQQSPPQPDVRRMTVDNGLANDHVVSIKHAGLGRTHVWSGTFMVRRRSLARRPS